MFTFQGMSQKLLHFPRWAEILENGDLPEAVKKSYKITLCWYLGWCRKCAVGCSVDSARAFVEWARKEKNANDWRVGQWKEAIRWFFVQGKRQALSVAGDCDTGSAKEDISPKSAIAPKWKGNHTENGEERLVGLSEEEAHILSFMRRRGMALRTERSYIRWYRDFLRQNYI